MESKPVARSSVRVPPATAVPAHPSHAPRDTLESVENALRLIVALDERGSLRVFEAAELLGVARSTAHRLLATLKLRGFAVQQDDSPLYRPGPALVRAGMRAMSRQDIRELASPHLASLVGEVGETAHLVVLEGNGIRFIDGAESPQPTRIGLRIGMVLPAHATAAGKAILAAMSPEAVRALYPRGVQTITDRTLSSFDAIESHLGEVARRGYATNIGESAETTAAVGVVVRDITGTPIAAIGLAAPTERMPAARIPFVANRVQRASMAITDDLQARR